MCWTNAFLILVIGDISILKPFFVCLFCTLLEQLQNGKYQLDMDMGLLVLEMTVKKTSCIAHIDSSATCIFLFCVGENLIVQLYISAGDTCMCIKRLLDGWSPSQTSQLVLQISKVNVKSFALLVFIPLQSVVIFAVKKLTALIKWEI